MMRPARIALVAAAAACAGGAVGGSAVSAAMLPQATATAPSNPLESARQLVVVTTPAWDSTSGVLRRFVRDRTGGRWRGVGTPVPVVVGRTGMAWDDASPLAVGEGPRKREGDGRSPAGAFSLDTAFGFASRARWVRMPYVALQRGSECVDDDASAHYNTVVDRGAVPRVDWTSAERMREVEQYRLGVIVGYNAAPPRRGRGSCIFLHVWAGPGTSTAGCTAFDAAALQAVIGWLEPARRPMLVQLPEREYDRASSLWKLPPR
jgi:D-alanyl-D-alanine dipeptidase